MNGRKILVCGGRDFNDELFVSLVLFSLIGDEDIIIHGDCKSGPDNIANRYAIDNEVEVKRYPADWQKYGKRAGPIRNQQMIDENPDLSLVIAFPGGKGTRDMIARATAARVEIKRFDPNDLSFLKDE